MILNMLSFSVILSTTLKAVPTESFDINADVNALVEANFADYAVASILLYRTPDERKKINDAVGQKRNGDKLVDDLSMEEVLNSEPLTNLWCMMFFDEYALLSSFLEGYLAREDELSIAMILILVKDMEKFMKVHKERRTDFDELCGTQKEAFKNLLKIWTEKSRELDPSGELNHDDVAKDAAALKSEQPKWNTTRSHLELILIKKSFKYASAVIAEYEKSLGGSTIEKIIKQSIKDQSLAQVYCSLATFIKDKYKYMANLISDQGYNELTWWNSWILLLATNKPEDWLKIDPVFRKDHKDKPLRKYILQTNTDHIFVECVATLMDPSYKPSFLDNC